MTDTAGAWDGVRADLNEAIVQGRQFEAAARRKGARQKDRHGIVTATANGFGEIVDLAISDQALKHPQLLGDSLTEAVAKARQAGRTVADRLRQQHFPAVPSSNNLAAVLEIPNSIHYDRLDYADSPEAKNLIAEWGGFLKKLADETKTFEQKSLRCEIGTAAGYVETDLANSLVTITIRPETPENIGLKRLTQQILTALTRASEQASRARTNILKKALSEWPA